MLAICCSGELVEPVAGNLVGSEHLFSELLVATGLDSVHLESVRVHVHEVVLGEQVGDGVHGSGDSEHHDEDHLLIGHLGSGDEGQVLGDVVSHLRSGRGSTIVILDHTVMELRRHGNNHVIEVGVEMATLRNIKTERRVVVIASQQVVRVVDKTGLMGQRVGQIWGPHTEVGVLGLMHSHVRRPHSVMDHALSVIPLLEVVTAVLLVTGMNLGQEHHLVHELTLTESLVHKKIILLMHGAVATLAGALPHLETSSQRGRVVGVPGDLRGPVVVTVVQTNGVDLLFVTLDTVRRTNVVSVDPSLSLLLDERSEEGLLNALSESGFHFLYF